MTTNPNLEVSPAYTNRTNLLNVHVNWCVRKCQRRRVLKSRPPGNCTFSNRHCKFSTEEITGTQNSDFALKFPKFCFLDENFLTRKRLTNNFPTVKRLRWAVVSHPLCTWHGVTDKDRQALKYNNTAGSLSLPTDWTWATSEKHNSSRV